MTARKSYNHQSSFCCTASAAATTSARFALVMDTAVFAVSISVCLMILRLWTF